MTNTFTNIILSNATESKAVTGAVLKTSCPKWRNIIDNIRLAVSNYEVAHMDNKADAEAVKKLVNKFYAEYKVALALLTFADEKLRPSSTDLQALCGFVGTWRKDKVTGKKSFMPVSKSTFCNNFEKFVAHRINSEISKTAEQDKADKEAKRLSKRQELKANKPKKTKKSTTKAA